MSGRLFFRPAGAEMIGMSKDGVPVLANRDGVGEMAEITAIRDLDFTFDEGRSGPVIDWTREHCACGRIWWRSAPEQACPRCTADRSNGSDDVR